MKKNDKVMIKESRFLLVEIHNKVAKVIEVITENVVKVKLSNGSVYKLYTEDLAEVIEVKTVFTRTNNVRIQKYYKLFETVESWYVKEVGSRGKRGGYFIPKQLEVIR